MGESSNERSAARSTSILRTLSLAPMHGWGITQRIQQATDGVLEVNQGSLYPALQRLEQKEWIGSEWRVTDNNRRASTPPDAARPQGPRRRDGELAATRGGGEQLLRTT